MSSMKSRKMNLFVIRFLVGITGILMFSFQNCSRIDTMQVSDIAGKAVFANELGSGNNNQDDQVNVQIQTEQGTTLNVDNHGNETVVEQPVVQVLSEQPPVDQQPVQEQPASDRPILVSDEDDDESDLDVCEAEERVLPGSMLATSQKIRCKKRHGKRDGIRCMDLIREHGVTSIDLARLENVSSIKSLKGKTILYTTNPDVSSARTLVINNAHGKTILCGVSIARLDIESGNLELREGSKIKSCGQIKGRIYKDNESSIDGLED